MNEIFDFNETKDSANATCRSFQVKTNCPKFITDGLQQRCHMTFSVFLFVTSRNLLFGVFKENYYNLTKDSRKFRTSALKVKYSESTWGKNKSLKHLYYKWTSSQVIFKVSSRIFFHLFTFPPICRSLFVLDITHIFCICIHICKRYHFPPFTIPEMESERKISLSFWMTFATS